MISPTALTVVLTLAIITAIYDSYTLRIPDALNATILISGLIFGSIIGQQSLYWLVLSVMLTYALMWGIGQAFYNLRGIRGLGLGDVKFTAAAAAWVGLQTIPSLLMIASIAGLMMWSCARMCGMQINSKTRLPFGPFLSLGLVWTWHSGPVQFF